jgi:hypothetical protein
MIPCICVNERGKPKEIPRNKWIRLGGEYHVIYTVTVLPQRQLAFHLSEIELDDTCAPYEYFLAHRFAFTEENLRLLIELIKDCSDTDFSMDELLEQTEVAREL